jgi:hypothetical protein
MTDHPADQSWANTVMGANFLLSSKIIKTAILLLFVHIGIINLAEENSKILEKSGILWRQSQLICT